MASSSSNNGIRYFSNDNPVFTFYQTRVEPVLKKAATDISRVSSQVGQMYETGRQKVVLESYARLPAPVASVVERISNVVPEVLCVLAAMTNVFTLPAFAYTAYRLLSPLSPVVATAMDNNSRQADMQIAYVATVNRLATNINRFLPAIGTVSIAASVAYAAAGLLTMSPSRLLKSELFAMTATGMFLARLPLINEQQTLPEQQ